MSKNKKITLLLFVLLLIFVFFLILAFYNIRIPCIFNVITGLNCPGCGSTRATVALFKLNFKEMLSYNLIYPLEIAYLIQFGINILINYYKKGDFTYKSVSKIIDISFITIFLAWGIIRNITPLY